MFTPASADDILITAVLYKFKIVFMTSSKYDIGGSIFDLLGYFADHSSICRVTQILRGTIYTSDQRINRTDNRQRDISTRENICKRKHMLFPCKETTMHTIAPERMMAGKYHQFFCIFARQVCYPGNQFILRLAITIRFYSRFIEWMYPPLTVKKDNGYIISQVDGDGSRATLLG